MPSRRTTALVMFVLFAALYLYTMCPIIYMMDNGACKGDYRNAAKELGTALAYCPDNKALRRSLSMVRSAID